ncbi:MAG: YerC/YecD family TrpR-related protein [Proteobacteria bacterium]|nr:YerC/YecD family TrpR-related protein [Pseudomonadota bacterium]MDA1063602.1 YerC/YecD family TrpR-related protein [Pseudomonadota bacterium]
MKPKRTDGEGQLAAAEQALCRAIVSLRTAEECRNFLHDLCTPAELQALVDRWQVVELLEDGLTYRRINVLTGVSVTTIGRVARFLADGFSGYRTVVDRAASRNNPTAH